MVEVRFWEIERKWQKIWEEKGVYEAKDKSNKPKYYVLEMFPYPSGTKLHLGHCFNYLIGDIYARYKKMKGYNVLHPFGFDDLGLPAENSAIKLKRHPKDTVEEAGINYVSQLKSLGISYDWKRLVSTHDEHYYKWDQWIFLKMYEKGLAFTKTSAVNWCPECKTVLANEQVQQGKCWRHKETNVEMKQLKQWYLKITDYAQELLDEIDKLDYPQATKIMQKNWIGKSHGTEIDFEINGEKWPVYTTRADTIYGLTFMVISVQHPRLMDIVTKERKSDVEKFLKKLRSVSEKEIEGLEKEGVFTGSYTINPLTGEKIPIWAGNFVLADYGGGMVIGVPAHDQRDFEFAKKYDLPIKVVISPEMYDLDEKKMSRAYMGSGTLVQSGKFDGMDNREAIDEITKELEKKGVGRKKVVYKLRDWLISRQRYWGTPIPIIYCEKCGVVPDYNLPVKLPYDVQFGEGNPLLTNQEWVNIKCPKCNGKAKRETDTMDTFVNSSWYFLRYCDPHNNKEIFDKKKVNYWCPIDLYVGGAEHACMHLIYYRFYTKFLRDLGLIEFGEPAKKLFHQGMLHGNDGYVMSKSRGNGVFLDSISKDYGIDTVRFFIMSVASPDKDSNWSDFGIEGSLKFIKKIFQKIEDYQEAKLSKRLEHKMNKTIREVTNYIEEIKYNNAIILIRDYFNSLPEKTSKESIIVLLKLLSVFCPHICEELWERIGGKGLICESEWPEFDKKKINEKFDDEDKMIEKLINDIIQVGKIMKEKGVEFNKVFVYVLPLEKQVFEEQIEQIKKRVVSEVVVYSVNDKEKYDPKGWAKKAKVGRPALYFE